MIETPATGRAKIFKMGNSLEVHIPSRKNWFIILFSSLWLGGWFMGESFAVTTLFFKETPGPGKVFLAVWLLAWTAGGFFVITVLLWTIAGKEIIKVENGILEIGQQIVSFRRSKKYSINELRHVSINPLPDNDPLGIATTQRSLFGLKGGVVKFDYGMKTFKFGGGIDEAEGRLLIEALKGNPNFKETNFA